MNVPLPHSFDRSQLLECASGAEPGRPDPATAAGTIGSIDRAVAAVRQGRAAAVVTNPIAKSVLYQAGFRHPGHTEYLAHLAAEGGVEPRPVMMLWSEELAVVPVTIHEPLRRVPELLTTKLIVETGRPVKANLSLDAGLLAAIDEAAAARGLTRSAFLASAAREKTAAEG